MFNAKTTRRVLTAALSLSIAGLAPLTAQEEPLKVAVVDVERIVSSSAAGRELQQRLESFSQEVQAELDRETEAAKALQQELVTKASALSDEARSRLEKDYEDKLIAIRRLRDDKQREGQKIQQQALQRIERQLEPVFRAVKDEMEIDLILALTPGVVLMFSDRIDLTEEILERFNAAQEAAGAAEGG